MKTMNYCYENITPLKNLTDLADKDDILFFDIETTGLSRQKNHIYLSGCGYYSDKRLNIIQWFAEGENEEVTILRQFLDFSSSFNYLVNYNGKSFDIPFTTERLNKYGLAMPELNSIDIYTYVKPLKKMLSLNDLTQKSVEAFLNIKRNDKYNGGELISVYKKWIELKLKAHLSEHEIDEFNLGLHNLLLHNHEDVLNMHYITEILDYSELFNAQISYSDYEINEYTDYSGEKKSEIILNGCHLVKIPKSYKTFYSNECGSFIMNVSDTGRISIRIPIIKAELFYYISNYRDYYYLPNEDICILKSMAGGVLKENRLNATKETCKIKLNDSFLPFEKKDDIPVKSFKNNIKAKYEYIRLEDFEGFSTDMFNKYINIIYNTFLIK